MIEQKYDIIITHCKCPKCGYHRTFINTKSTKSKAWARSIPCPSQTCLHKQMSVQAFQAYSRKSYGEVLVMDPDFKFQTTDATFVKR